jgi:hypothetical protein
MIAAMEAMKTQTTARSTRARQMNSAATMADASSRPGSAIVSLSIKLINYK